MAKFAVLHLEKGAGNDAPISSHCLILLLDEHGYPPVERDEVYVEIFEQAENFKKNR